jgi:hypothetical protein
MLEQTTADAVNKAIADAATYTSAINPIIPFILGMVGAAIQQEPKVEATLRALFTAKAKVTAEDFDAAIAHIDTTTYSKLVPASDLPPDASPPASPMQPS